MQQVHRQQVVVHLLGLLLSLWLIVSLAGCNLVDRLNAALYPTAVPTIVENPQDTSSVAIASETPTTVFTPAPTVNPTVVLPEPTQTPAPQPTVAPTAVPRPEEGQHMVYARGNGIYRGDFYGDEPVEVASVLVLEASDFNQGLLATTQGRSVALVDLNRGALTSFQVKTAAAVDYAEVVWGADNKTLLYVALVPDAQAQDYGRNVELHILSAKDGAEQGKMVIPDISNAQVLRYDEGQGRVLLIEQGSETVFTTTKTYEVKTGRVVSSAQVNGEGEAKASPDGRYLLTQRFSADTAQLYVYDLMAKSPPQVWDHPPLSHSVSHLWSPDGKRVAYLLRDGKTYSDESTQGLGLWVLDIASMKARRVLDEPGLSSSLLAWTPGGEYIVGFHRGQTDEDHFFAVHPDGGGRRILNLGKDAEFLGWMPYVGKASVAKVVGDTWQMRFAQAGSDAGALADVAAQFVASQGQATDEALTQQVQRYLFQAGAKSDLVGPTIKRVARGLYVAQLPPLSICVLEAGKAQVVASGHVLLDARQEGNDLGLIFGVMGASGVQPTYELLRRQGEEPWQVLWSPQGQRDWIATDGEIRFSGKGLQTLQVAGSSFGLDLGADEVFAECHACPHRQFRGAWIRRGDAYSRQTKLAEGAPLADVLWEMTEPKPYGVLYESLRRLRLGLPTQNLVKDASVINQIRTLGLLEKNLRLIPEEETANTVRFSDAPTQQLYRASLQGGRIVRVERITR